LDVGSDGLAEVRGIASSGSRTTATQCSLFFSTMAIGASFLITASFDPPNCSVKPITAKRKGKLMSEEIELPLLFVTNGKSGFSLRCHAAAWADEYSGSVKIHRGHSENFPGLLLLSATGPDTAVKSVRASLYEPEIHPEFTLHIPDAPTRMVKARSTVDGKPVSYSAAVSKLAPGVIHLVAVARIPGLMPNMSDDHLWTEFSGSRYTTPLLRSWMPWLKQAMTKNQSIVVAKGFGTEVGVLKAEPDELDDLVSKGVKGRHLALSL
jgi:hypothetical protein